MFSRAEIRYGVQLDHLSKLSIPNNAHFLVACDFVRAASIELPKEAYRSYACYLRSDPTTAHLVKEVADVFVSYAWAGRFGPTMTALREFYAGREAETYVWMDFAVLDQHDVGDVDFTEWANVFETNLRLIKKAVLVLTPGQAPIAMTRSWCCFEWITILDCQIDFEICVPESDEDAMLSVFEDGKIRAAGLWSVIGEVNVEKAQAYKKHDELAILERLRKIGIVKVNDIVLGSVKTWLLGVLDKGIKKHHDSEDETREMLLQYSRGTLLFLLGQYEKAIAGLNKAAEMGLAKSISYRTDIHSITAMRSYNQLGLVYGEMRKLDEAESMFLKALDMANRTGLNSDDLFYIKVEYIRDIALLYNNLGTILFEKGDLDLAREYFGGSLSLDGKANRDGHGDDGLHFPLARTMNNLAGISMKEGKFSRAVHEYREVVEIVRADPDNPKLAEYLMSLAIALIKQGKLETLKEAKALVIESLAINERAFGQNHPLITQGRNLLVTIKTEQRKKSRAKRFGYLCCCLYICCIPQCSVAIYNCCWPKKPSTKKRRERERERERALVTHLSPFMIRGSGFM